MEKNNLLGPWGEQLAAAYLQKKRYRMIACNYKCRMGEIDIICKYRNYLVFVEVKLRKSDRFGEAREFVGTKKQQRLIAAAMFWLQQNPTDLQPRFDVIEIYAPEGIASEHPEIIHLEDAFQSF
jgi:putative endonuclease